jgi:hypothetical protein
MESDQVRELKQLQDENQRLKKLVADLSLDKAILQDINSKKMARPASKRQAVNYIVGHYATAWRRGCRFVRLYRSVQYYNSCKDPLTVLRARMRELARVRVRYGYRRLHVLLRREGWALGRSYAANDPAGARWLSRVQWLFDFGVIGLVATVLCRRRTRRSGPSGNCVLDEPIEDGIGKGRFAEMACHW